MGSWVLLTLVGGVVGLILAISGLMMLRSRAPAKDRAAILYARFIRKTGLQQRSGETPQGFARRAALESEMSHHVVASVTTNYLNARYGPDAEYSLGKLRNSVAAIR
jgi:hypothetical protein